MQLLRISRDTTSNSQRDYDFGFRKFTLKSLQDSSTMKAFSFCLMSYTDFSKAKYRYEENLFVINHLLFRTLY
jgi:hypothetical protein